MHFLSEGYANSMTATSVIINGDHKALEILGIYLTSSATAPLNKEYIEIEQPLWFVRFLFHDISLTQSSAYMYFAEDTCATRVDLSIYIGSVPVEHLDDFNSKLRNSFQRIAKEGIDMKRMAMVLNREERQVL